MCRLIETICVKNGSILHLPDHQERLNRSVFHHFGTSVQPPVLEDILTIPEHALEGWYKCRVIYNAVIESISWEPYQIRKIKTMALVHADDIEYSHKYADRTKFNQLVNQAGTGDVIIVKEGFVTDSSYANLLFYKKDKWFTPATPLLEGTQRKRLLDSGIIQEEIIKPRDLAGFTKMKLINAMLDMDFGPEYLIERQQASGYRLQVM